MSCPDIERIIDIAAGDRSDPEALAHVSACADCKRELAMVREVAGAMDPSGLLVPPDLIERAFVAATRTESVPSRPLFGREVVAGLLGGATVLLTLIGTGAVGDAGLGQLVVWTAVGAVAVAIRERSTARTEIG